MTSTTLSACTPSERILLIGRRLCLTILFERLWGGLLLAAATPVGCAGVARWLLALLWGWLMGSGVQVPRSVPGLSSFHFDES
jgi:hypothetical protein